MKSLYFIGIAGSAMGNVAIACAKRGFSVSGSDAGIYPPMSTNLEKNNIEIYETFSEENFTNKSIDLVIVGNAISRGNVELEYVLNHRIPFTSMSALVHDEIIGKNTSIVITGTHGKTTTTSITAWLFEHAGKEPGFLIGGIPGGFESGCRPVPEELHTLGKGICIIEGDEYDTAFWDKRSKFFHYSPSIAVINAIEFDHGDIFDSLEQIRKSFRTFIRLIPGNGLLLVSADSQETLDILPYAYSRTETFGIAESADWKAVNIRQTENGILFECHYKKELLAEMNFTMRGNHNVRNALAAIACAYHSGLPIAEIQQGLQTFLPPKRRMEILGEWEGRMIIDDFAHHPTAIAETIKSLKETYPQRNIIACFEPRSNTTTRNIFQKELGECFQGASAVIIGPVNRPERYAEHERLDITSLLNEYKAHDIQTFSIQENVPEWGKLAIPYFRECSKTGDIIVLMSNGNIGNLRTLLFI